MRTSWFHVLERNIACDFCSWRRLFGEAAIFLLSLTFDCRRIYFRKGKAGQRMGGEIAGDESKEISQVIFLLTCVGA
jgi:hypothetical protein